jgi:SOS response associated peptidase (SRAP)
MRPAGAPQPICSHTVKRAGSRATSRVCRIYYEGTADVRRRRQAPAPSRTDGGLAVLSYIAATCGRATYKLTWEEIVPLYRLTLGQPAVNTQARYNVCPTTTVDTIVGPDGKRELVRMRWGVIPSWWSKPLKEMKLATFNARAETVRWSRLSEQIFRVDKWSVCRG